MINYSIIIPHKNLPDLLTRCLASIPDRDDVQIIVVDDNSDPSIVDFSNFPVHAKNNVQLIFDKSGLGAGHARNIGLQLALGKWLVFADCDDFFDKVLFSEQLDAFISSDCDLVFFKINYVNSETLVPAAHEHRVNQVFDFATKTNDFNYIRFGRNAPWAKFVRRELVLENKISFQETQWSNDAWFSTQVALLAKNAQYIDARIYNYTYRENSLIKATSAEALLCRFEVALKCEGLLLQRGFGKYRLKHAEYWYFKLLQTSLRLTVRSSKKLIKTFGLKSYVLGLFSNIKHSF